MSNAVPPSVVYPSPNEWPDTIRHITGISNSAQATVTSPSHGFSSADVNTTFVGFLQVRGMLPVNGSDALIQSIVDADTITVNINTSAFPVYRGGGVMSILTGIPPVQTTGFQTFNTPFQNTF